MEWSVAGGEPAIRVRRPDGEVLGAVTVQFESRFGRAVQGWEVGPLWVEEASTMVPVLVPTGVGAHPEQARFVTDLRVTATIDGEVVLGPEAYLAWPDGLGGPCVVWTHEQMRVSAPQGVLDPTLRVTEEDGAEVRIMPPIDWGRITEQTRGGDR